MLHYVTIVCLLGAAHSAPSAGLIGPAYGVSNIAVGSVSNPAYGFNYAVSDPLTGDNKAQSEQREGGVVRGSYSLAEPDGTIRVVDYTADPVSGFNAVVKRIGPAAHPQRLVAPVIAAPVAPVITAPVVSKAIIEPIAPIGLGLAELGYGLKGGLGLGGLGGLGLNGIGIGLGGLELGALNGGLYKH